MRNFISEDDIEQAILQKLAESVLLLLVVRSAHFQKQWTYCS